MMLSDGAGPDGRQILPAAVVATAMSNQVSDYALQPTAGGSPRQWGFGWRRQWAAHPASFGDFVSRNTIGHWGATGTLLWIDPDSGRYAVILTNSPYEDSCASIQRLSNVAATV
jgi:CubicO group peptidase (beta-lactamase class C family)